MIPGGLEEQGMHFTQRAIPPPLVHTAMSHNSAISPDFSSDFLFALKQGASVDLMLPISDVQTLK